MFFVSDRIRTLERREDGGATVSCQPSAEGVDHRRLALAASVGRKLDTDGGAGCFGERHEDHSLTALKSRQARERAAALRSSQVLERTLEPGQPLAFHRPAGVEQIDGRCWT